MPVNDTRCPHGFPDQKECQSCKKELKRLNDAYQLALKIVALPEPMRDEPEAGTEYYYLHSLLGHIEKYRWTGNMFDKKALEAGLCHTTREAARVWLDWWNQAVGRDK